MTTGPITSTITPIAITTTTTTTATTATTAVTTISVLLLASAGSPTSNPVASLSPFR